jgi:DNA-3-methyladenine glycosylase
VPTAVLIRALEPTEGLGRMAELRSGRIARDRLKPTDLCSGPAKLTQALAIDRDLDGEDLVASDRLFVERGRPIAKARLVAARRIGVAYAGEWADRPLRYYQADNPHVSVRRS